MEIEVKRRFVATCRWFGPQLKWRVKPCGVAVNGKWGSEFGGFNGYRAAVAGWLC